MDNFRGQETGAGGAVPLLFGVPGKSHSHVGSPGRGQWGGGTTDFVHETVILILKISSPNILLAFQSILLHLKVSLVPVICS